MMVGIAEFNADVGIAGGKIVDIGRLNSSTKRMINVDGRRGAGRSTRTPTRCSCSGSPAPRRVSRGVTSVDRQLRAELGAGKPEDRRR
jgi:hypothetical protein